MTQLIVTVTEEDNKELLIKCLIKDSKSSTADEMEAVGLLLDEVEDFLDECLKLDEKDKEEAKRFTIDICKNIGKEKK